MKLRLAWAYISWWTFRCWADDPASGRPACPSRGSPVLPGDNRSRCSVGRRPGEGKNVNLLWLKSIEPDNTLLTGQVFQSLTKSIRRKLTNIGLEVRNSVIQEKIGNMKIIIGWKSTLLEIPIQLQVQDASYSQMDMIVKPYHAADCLGGRTVAGKGVCFCKAAYDLWVGSSNDQMQSGRVSF